MSDTEPRKSMDDVLASIRRIVRAEKQPAPNDATEIEDETIAESEREAGDSPLALTPDMRLSDAEQAEMNKVDEAASFVSAPPMVEPIPSMNDETIKSMIRDVIEEELSSGRGAELVRAVIRDELTTGEIGGNISRNVLRMIRAEVAKAGQS